MTLLLVIVLLFILASGVPWAYQSREDRGYAPAGIVGLLLTPVLLLLLLRMLGLWL